MCFYVASRMFCSFVLFHCQISCACVFHLTSIKHVTCFGPYNQSPRDLSAQHTLSIHLSSKRLESVLQLMTAFIKCNLDDSEKGRVEQLKSLLEVGRRDHKGNDKL